MLTFPQLVEAQVLGKPGTLEHLDSQSFTNKVDFMFEVEEGQLMTCHRLPELQVTELTRVLLLWVES